MNTAAARARGDSVASRKHVDFSLGMRDIVAGDVMGDVFEDRGQPRFDVDVVRESNRETTERIQEEEEERRTSASASSRGRRRTGSGAGGNSNINLSVASNNQLHPTESQGNNSVSSSLTRNRFFRRRSNASREAEDLESGRARNVSPGDTTSVNRQTSRQ